MSKMHNTEQHMLFRNAQCTFITMDTYRARTVEPSQKWWRLEVQGIICVILEVIPILVQTHEDDHRGITHMNN